MFRAIAVVPVGMSVESGTIHPFSRSNIRHPAATAPIIPPGESAMLSADPPTAMLVVVLVIAGILGWACYRLLVDRGRLLLRLGEAAEDESAPARGLVAGSFLSDFALPALSASDTASTLGDEEVVTLSSLSGRPLLLVFVRADCFFSRAFARELAGHASGAATPAPVLVVAGVAPGREDLAPFGDLGGPVLLDPDGHVARLMRVPMTPAGYHVAANRRTVGDLLVGPRALIAAARGEPLPDHERLPRAVTPLPPAPAIEPLERGAAAPRFCLPTTADGEWSLQAHLGRSLTLIFSDPGCPPCATLLTELGRRDASGIVLVSRGDAAENRQLVETAGVEAPVLIQRQREVARAYRTLETPAAFTIDAAGAIVAGPAIGTEEVLALLARNVRTDPVRKPDRNEGEM
jgi:peroxiredoxin